MAPGCRGAPRSALRRHRFGCRSRCRGGVPARAHPAALPGRHQARRPPGSAGRATGLRTDLQFAAGEAARHGLFVHASLYELAEAGDGLGYNTAILVGPDGRLVARTRKLHLPVTEGYFEDAWFRPGAAADPYPVTALPVPAAARLGLPTCWDEWFPEVARAYSLGGAELLAYPTAIGSEPDHPGFDTRPLWQQVIVANGVSSGLFMVVPNRWGVEGRIRFYGSSFISDPYGRVLAQAPRDGDAVLVAALDLDQRTDWLELFPFLSTRRPDTYGALLGEGPAPA
ncbi:MAG: hydrolase [Propionibacteriaceae bacterium]|nr:hydrolase [Propionibacteriaceae bacterium]